MTASWPGTVPTRVREGSYQESPEDNVARFTPEVGEPKERRRMSISSDTVSFVSQMSSAQYDDLLTFWRTTLKDGVLPFYRIHPRTGVLGTFKFTARPEMNHVLSDVFAVKLSMRKRS